jgi:membrane protease YdiL (CAAX protease family)
MTGAADRWAAAEAITACAAVLAYIWIFREAYIWLWAPFLAALLVSHRLRRESISSLGFRTKDLARAAAAIAPWLFSLLAVLLVAGVALGTVNRFGTGRVLSNLVRYLAWGVVQQYLLNGYFLNRLRPAFGDGRGATLAAILFSCAHLPNPFLMTVTFAGGNICSRVYLKHGNLWVLGLAHGLIGFTLHLITPPEISGGFLVGPRYLSRADP